MVTAGGITEAIINSLLAGEPIDVALQKGMNRTQEISTSTRQYIANHMHGMPS